MVCRLQIKSNIDPNYWNDGMLASVSYDMYLTTYLFLSYVLMLSCFCFIRIRECEETNIVEEWFDLDVQGRIKISIEFESVEAGQGLIKVRMKFNLN